VNQSLVVVDSRIIRHVARTILEDLQFDTAEAADGEAALEFCRERMPDLILLDFDLPKPSAMEFLRKLRHESGGQHPVVLFCTTEKDVEQISQAMALGANDYVQKPFDRETIQAKLAAAGLIEPAALARTAG
jgi:two-component system chemotaxis response regulator CheY